MDSNAKHLTNIYVLFTFKQLITEQTLVNVTSYSIIYHTSYYITPAARADLCKLALEKQDTSPQTAYSRWKIVRS